VLPAPYSQPFTTVDLVVGVVEFEERVILTVIKALPARLWTHVEGNVGRDAEQITPRLSILVRQPDARMLLVFLLDVKFVFGIIIAIGVSIDAG